MLTQMPAHLTINLVTHKRFLHPFGGNMDIAKALTYVTEDKEWITKIGIAVLVSLLSFLIIPIPILIGYSVAISRNVKKGVEQPLPVWDDWGSFFRDGLNVIIAQLVYTLPFWLLSCIVFISTIGFEGLAEQMNSPDLLGAAFLATFGIVGCLTLLFAVALMFISPAIVLQYLRTNELGACLRFGEVIGIARQNLSDILMVTAVSIGLGFVLSALFAILNIFPCLGQIVSLVLSLAVGPYIMAVTGHLYGQVAQKMEGKAAEFMG